MMSDKQIEVVQKIAFSISYDGEGTLYEKHQIRADDLAKIIGSMNNLILKSDQILHGKESQEPLLTITAPVKEGSVIIEFLVSDIAIDTLKFIGLSATSGVIGSSAFELIKKIGNRAPKVIKVKKKEKTSIIEIDDKTTMEVPTEVVKILDNKNIREDIDNIIHKPTYAKNAVVKVKDEKGDAIQVISSQESVKYKVVEMDDSIPDAPEYRNTMIRFIRINFDNPKDWTFKFESDKTINPVTIEDKDFLLRIQDAKESFEANKLFEVRLKIINQKTATKRTKKTYTIEKVGPSHG